MTTSSSRRDDLVAAWQREEREPFAGWDFSYLDGRMFEEQPPWSYPERAGELMDRASSVVDLDTGGGERLLSLHKHWPARVVATEDWPPNVKLATERLSPHGATVVDVHNSELDPLPFGDAEFDLVLNRHGAFNSAEVARILSPGGAFLTQQVHGRWAEDLLALFAVTPQWPNATLERYVPLLESAGLAIITAQNWSGTLAFADVGALVYYLKAIPWMVPGFSVATHGEVLFAAPGIVGRWQGTAFVPKYVIEAHKDR